MAMIYSDTTRNLSPLDRLLAGADRALRTVTDTATARQPSPAAGIAERELDSGQRTESARLMRVNHVGEICAQALYQGQAAAARTPVVADAMRQAAEEENDHLAWCSERITELGGRPSVLNPLWYAGAFAIGAAAGLIGDRVSLGFVAETEKQVGAHLDEHLHRLPDPDARSRAVLERMREDELRHATKAMEAGGTELPFALRRLMHFAGRVMTRTAYWI